MGDAHVLERILDGVDDPTDLSLALLQKITNNFSEDRKIGQGGFGEVYKGELGERIVAVKRIDINENTLDDRLFRRECVSLWNTIHRNVVRILGFCSNTYTKMVEDPQSGKAIFVNVLERLLCFEYISNGSLDKHITDELRGLEWETRYEIIIGICKGLRYLHKEKNIIHMDLKPANILLDHQDEKYMVPKITDFGLSRSNKNSHTVGKCFGTLEYMAPEYRDGSKTTQSCDIYSLGLIIIELVTGSKDVPNKDNVLRRWRHRWKKPPTQLQYQQVTRCIDVAGRCRRKNPKDRPASIWEIINFLSLSESTYWQISPLLDEDDMLRIKPIELRLPSELKNEISCSVELTNDARNCIAFNIQLPSAQYRAQPVRGIVQLGSTYVVTITVQARDVREHDHADKLIMQSMQVEASEGLRDEDITESMFEKTGFFFDEVDLMVVYEPTKPQQNFKSREDTNTAAEEVPEAKKRKIVESASGKGKNKLGSSENVEADSMDMSSSARGQYTKQLDRCNFHPPENFSHSQPTNMTYIVRASDRAMDVTRGAMGSLLHKLGVLHKEFNLKTSVEKDADELVKMQQVLRKVSAVQQHKLDDLVKRWASNFREMSYDLEDFVDGFRVHSEPDSDGSGHGRASVRELTHEMHLEKGKSHQPVGDLIKHHISKQVQDAAEKCKEYNVDDTVANATTKSDIEDPRFSAIHIDREQLIGIEERKKVLIRLLEEDGDVLKLKIVSIVGLGGLGKTTLAKAVYDKLKAQYHFRDFVTVGQNPDVKEILKNILYACRKDLNATNLDVSKLLDELHEFLENKRYFIVIDDIWDSLKWNSIRRAFPENKNGSRVMITTRDRCIALACCNSEKKNVYEIKPLDDEESRRLFFRRAFGPEKDCPDTPRKEEISKYILKRCGGMPLAINSTASLLNGEEDTAWENVWKSLGALSEGKTAVDNMKEILDLSYIHLSDDLKTCLLYVCMYPEDWEIDKNELLRKWVAEGFVSRKDQLDAEDVAENNFKALINMYMIQPEVIDYNNEVLSFRVHDLILDLIRSKSTKANFIQVIDGSKEEIGAGEIRRVSVHYGTENMRILEKINKMSLEHVRSVLVFQTSLIPYFLVFKYVRVLHLEDREEFWMDRLDLTGISRLFLLRYLQVQMSYAILELPDQIGQLQQLETIYLNGCRPEKYPSDFVSLPRLWHLKISNRLMALPDGIGRMKSLRTLTGVDLFESSVDNIKGLSELTNLTTLKVYRLNDEPDRTVEVLDVHMNALCSSISRLSTSLRILEIYGDPTIGSSTSLRIPGGSPIRKLDLSGCYFQRCPEWIGQLHHLYSLDICVREVAHSLSIVAGLPSLANLELGDIARYPWDEESVGIPGTGSGAFQALKRLIVYYRHKDYVRPSWDWQVKPPEELTMPSRFNIIPVGIEHLPAGTLKKINLSVSLHPRAYIRIHIEGSIPYTRQLLELIEEQKDSVRMGIESDAPPLVDTSLHLAVGSEGRTQDLESLQLPFTSLLAPSSPSPLDLTLALALPLHGSPPLPPCSSPGKAETMANFPVDFNIDLAVQQGNNGMLVNAVAQNLNHNFPPGGLVDLNQAPDWLNGGNCYYTEDDEAAYDQVNGSETSPQVQANTRHFVELIEAQEDSGRMSIDTDAPPTVDMSLHLAVGSEGRTEDLESLQLPLTSFTNLALCSSPDGAEPVANFPVDINNDLLVEAGVEDGDGGGGSSHR